VRVGNLCGDPYLGGASLRRALWEWELCGDPDLGGASLRRALCEWGISAETPTWVELLCGELCGSGESLRRPHLGGASLRRALWVSVRTFPAMVAEWFSAPHSSCGPMGSNPIHGINSEKPFLTRPAQGLGRGDLR